MRNDKLFTGLLIVGIGLVFLLDNLHIINFHWSSIWRLWPVILIITGVNLLFANTNSSVATAVRLLVIVGGLAFIIIHGTDDQYANRNRWGFHLQDRDRDRPKNENDDENDSKNSSIERISASSTFTENYAPSVKIAKLFVSGGGTEYKVDGADSALFNAVTDEVFGHYDLKRNDTDSVSVLSFKMRDEKRHWNFDDKKSNEVHMKLNAAPLWDIDINAGATHAEFDLTPFKVRSFVFNGGAAAVDVKLGDKMNNTAVKIESGAAAVHIKIPRSSGCIIKTHSGLSSRDFEGFDKLDNDTWQTPGYASAKNKITMTLKGGVSSFEVLRY